MEVYKRETKELVKRFMDNRITFPQCMHGLDAALSDLVSSTQLKGEDLPELRAIIMANNETVMKGLERRGPPDKVQ
ncbi:MAG: hypothetical protein WBW33_03260 [Bryobacteraceae bacterium]